MIEPLHRWHWRIVAECLAWALPVGAFLSVYVHHFAGAASAVLPHLKLVGAVLVALWSLRLLAWLWLPRRLATAAATLLLGMPFALLAAYYSLVLVGQHSWGRVISWTLISTYAAQWQALSMSIGLAPAAVVAAVCLLAAAACAAAFLLVRRDWLLDAAMQGSRLTRFAMVAVGPVLLVVGAYQFVVAPPVHAREPFSLTLYPQQGTSKLQNHGVRGTELQRSAAQADSDAYVPSPAARQRNVVLVVADALRADRLGIYGHARQTTPFLDSMAAQGRLQKASHMSAACAESMCGLLAIARSKYVHELSEDDLSLHEVMRRHGWRVHLLLGGDHTNFYGLRAAYGVVNTYVDGSMTPGFYMNDDNLVIDQLAHLPAWDGRPHMFQLHLMSSHPLGVRHDAATRFLPAAPYLVVGRGTDSGSSHSHEKAVNHYDNGVLQVDSLLNKALVVLEQKGYLKEAVVVLTGDHGEMLGEHGEYGHSKSVHEPALKVPFVMLNLGYEPEHRLRDADWAAQVDIAPTILAELNMPQPRSWSGVRLQAPPRRDWIYFRQGHQVGLYDVRQQNKVTKYVRDLRRGSETAFDAMEDPAERDNIIAAVPLSQRREWQNALLPAVAAVVD